jgi:hypothetical protein
VRPDVVPDQDLRVEVEAAHEIEVAEMVFEVLPLRERHEQALGVHLEVDAVRAVGVEHLGRVRSQSQVRLEPRSLVPRVAPAPHAEQERHEARGE